MLQVTFHGHDAGDLDNLVYLMRILQVTLNCLCGSTNSSVHIILVYMFLYNVVSSGISLYSDTYQRIMNIIIQQELIYTFCISCVLFNGIGTITNYVTVLSSLVKLRYMKYKFISIYKGLRYIATKDPNKPLGIFHGLCRILSNIYCAGKRLPYTIDIVWYTITRHLR